VSSEPIACLLKVSEGFLYLLDEGLMWLQGTKVVFTKIGDVARIEITGGSSHMFDFEVESVAHSRSHLFRIDV
jgi:hypothetical protein